MTDTTVYAGNDSATETDLNEAHIESQQAADGADFIADLMKEKGAATFGDLARLSNEEVVARAQAAADSVVDGTGLDTEVLDLRPLLKLRAPAAALAVRLRAGDVSAVDEVTKLADSESAIISRLETVFAQLGIDDPDAQDAIYVFVNGLGIGQLPWHLDVALGRTPGESILSAAE